MEPGRRVVSEVRLLDRVSSLQSGKFVMIYSRFVVSVHFCM